MEQNDTKERGDKMSKTLVVHTSDRILFKRCRRKWDFASSLRQHLEPDPPTDVPALWLGTGIHFALEDYHGYNRFGDPVEALVAYREAFREDELPEGADELIALGIGMLENYREWLAQRNEFETLWLEGVPQVEVQFQLELTVLSEYATKLYGEPVTVLYQGAFDRVVVDAFGRLWVVDYKTVKNIDTNKLATDPQISAYAWAAEQWYQRPVEGVVYLQMVKDVPQPPEVLLNGSLSVNKNQKTTHALYRRALLERYPDGRFPPKYIDFLNYLAEQETPEGNRFIRWDFVRRNTAAKLSTYNHILNEGREMIDPNISIYPNPTRDCAWDCPFRTVCVAMDEGSDWRYLVENDFRKKEEGTAEWRNRIKWPEPNSSK